MQLICSNCHQPIDSENVNIATDLAKCEHCGSIHKASALATATDTKKLSAPPAGSAIEMQTELGNAVSILFPAKGFTASDIPQILFMTFWFCFIAFWTFMASRGLPFFALFSVPFWLGGLTMVSGIINNISEKQRITVGNGQLVVEKIRPIFPKQHTFSFPDIQSIKPTPMAITPFSMWSNPRFMWRRSWATGGGPLLPAVLTGEGTVYFFEAANEAEQEWVTQYLENRRRQG